MTVDVGRYVSRLINQPWRRDTENCWHLAKQVLRELFGCSVEFPLGADWREVELPTHGALVLMRQPTAAVGTYDHAGVYLDLDGGGVLHANDPHGSVFDSPAELVMLRRWVPTYFTRGATA